MCVYRLTVACVADVQPGSAGARLPARRQAVLPLLVLLLLLLLVSHPPLALLRHHTVVHRLACIFSLLHAHEGRVYIYHSSFSKFSHW